MGERTCSVDGCLISVGRHGARGFCSKHYKQRRSSLPPLQRRADAQYPSDDEIVAAMRQGGSLSQAAVLMGVHRRSLHTFLSIRPALRERVEAERRRTLTDDERRERSRLFTRKYRALNPERARKQRRESMAKYGPEYRQRWNHYNRLRRRGAAVPNELANEYALLIRNDPCVYCGAPTEHIDHIEPLATGGTGAWDNLAPTCAPCNFSKQARSVLHFMLARRSAAS